MAGSIVSHQGKEMLLAQVLDSCRQNDFSLTEALGCSLVGLNDLYKSSIPAITFLISLCYNNGH